MKQDLSEQLKVLGNDIDDIEEIVMQLLELSKPVMDGEHYLTDSELSGVLKVSRRTLADWRANGILPYYQINGKILYRESEIQKLLEDSYNPPFEY